MYFPILNKDGFGEAVKRRHNRRFWDEPKKAAAAAWTGVESRVVAAASTGWAACVGKHWKGGDRTASFNSTQCRCRGGVLLLLILPAFLTADKRTCVTKYPGKGADATDTGRNEIFA
jgi:hypothetical protein